MSVRARVDGEAGVRGGGGGGGARAVRRVLLLGSTGSIGTQAVEVIAHLNALAEREERGGRFEVVGLLVNRNAKAAWAQARALGVRSLGVSAAELGAEDERAVAEMIAAGVKVYRGAAAAERMVREIECEVVLAAMVGASGIGATLAAVELGRDVALANKETLVAAGALVTAAARRSGARLLPVDSEHSGVWQCLVEEGVRNSDEMSAVCPPMACGWGGVSGVKRIVLTASGGPFRSLSKEACYHATVAQALKHPTWTMGAKVTIDSASLTNKALELIEAHWLFGVGSDQLGAVIHPQSVVHSMVEMLDGSVVAQLGAPDMRTPIQLALTYPQRCAGVSKTLDLLRLGTLEFFEATEERFEALGLAHRVIREGGTSGAVFNGASEAAVEAYLEGKVAFGAMPGLARGAMDALGVSAVRELADIHEADAAARAWVRSAVKGDAGAVVVGGVDVVREGGRA
jgi:1-deoxy-D-xylulose-5-phosphate reductoisomerase